MRTVLITLIAPERTVDLVVDADTPVFDLLPHLLSSGGVAEKDADPAAWNVVVMGRQVIPPDQTLEQAEVLDGAILVLRRQAAPDASAAAAPAAAAGSQPRRATGSPANRARQLLRGLGPTDEVIRSFRARRCVTVAVLSPKGGVGKTTVAILLGELFAKVRGRPVIALDTDSDYGSLGRIQPAHYEPAGSGDADTFVQLSQTGLTFAELDRRVWKLPAGLRLVPSPRDPARAAKVDRAEYARVIGGLQRLSEMLILDCGTGLGQPGAQAAVLASDLLVLVSDATGPSTRLAADAAELLARAGRPLLVVINRTGRHDDDPPLAIDGRFPIARALVSLPEGPGIAQALAGGLELDSLSRPARTAAGEFGAVLSRVLAETRIDAEEPR
ncbi:MAG: hypothetical protein J2O48_00555 [Solirubrobacterales bacterium]|nr:hypothetical protein [Solirubrobacterales bacterium]